jgi:hypothetical protein
MKPLIKLLIISKNLLKSIFINIDENPSKIIYTKNITKFYNDYSSFLRILTESDTQIKFKKKLSLITYFTAVLEITGSYMKSNSIRRRLLDSIIADNFEELDLNTVFSLLFQHDYNMFIPLVTSNYGRLSNRQKFFFEFFFNGQFNLECRNKAFNFKKSDNHFYESIVNKDILVIGPGLYNINDLKTFIYGSETVVFVNHNYELDSEIIKSLETKELVFYYSGDREQYLHNKILKREIPAELRNADYIITSNNRKTSRISYNTAFTSPKFRGFQDFKFLFLNGKLNFLFHVCFDLILYNPKSIRLLGFDLYMNVKPYRENYFSYDKSLMSLSLGFHSPSLQYNMLKRLHQSNLFIFDSGLAAIMENGLDYYLTRMEELYCQY